MKIKWIAVYAVIAALLVVIGVQKVQLSQAGTRPTAPRTPITFAVREYGETVLAREYICERLTLTVLGPHHLQHNGDLTTITVYYHDRPDTRVLADIGPIPTTTGIDRPTC